MDAWLSIVGVGEDGMSGLSAASRAVLAQAEVVMGARRHLALVGTSLAGTVERLEWPVPFEAGVAQVLALRGRRVVVLASGDPFWFGAGTVLARRLPPGEWRAWPAPSTFSLAAAQLGWALEHTTCIGLHAAPFARLRPLLAQGRRLLVLVRDGEAAGALVQWLSERGFGDTRVHVLEALGGPRQRVRSVQAAGGLPPDVAHPVVLGLEVSLAQPRPLPEAEAAPPVVMPCTSGLDDRFFAHDGQITKRPLRALTLSALAPRAGELLWDIGAGSGSIGIEWLLADPANRAVAFEADRLRAARARDNAAALGVAHLQVVEGRAPQVLAGQPLPDAVFIGGGLSQALLDSLWACLPPGARVVANAVTLESEALLGQWHAQCGGQLLRVELSEAAPLGRRRGWKAAYPVVQWSVSR